MAMGNGSEIPPAAYAGCQGGLSTTVTHCVSGQCWGDGG